MKNEQVVIFKFDRNKEKLEAIEINLINEAIHIMFHDLKNISTSYTTLNIEKVDSKKSKKGTKGIFYLKDVNDFHFALADFSRLCQTFPEKIGYTLKRTGRTKIYNKVASEISFLIPEGDFIYNDTISLSSLEELRRIEFECNILRHFFYRKDWSFSYKRHFYSKEEIIIKKVGNIVELGI